MLLVGVGMGPGDPELVTVKAVRVLQSADRIFVPVLTPDEAGYAEATVRAHVGHDRIERLVFALNERSDRGRRERHWDAAGERVAAFLGVGLGATAAFATIGDPNVYSTFSYLAQTVRALLPDVDLDTVPGITAAQDLAARSGTPLAEGVESLTLLPLASGVEGLAAALEKPGSVVTYKSGRHVTGVVEAVRRAGRLHGAVFGARLGLAGQMIRPLAAVDGGSAPYLSTVLVPARRGGRGGAL